MNQRYVLHRIQRVGLIAMSVLVVACTNQHTETQQVGDVVMSVTTQPNHLHVGENADVYVTLRSHRSGVSGCRVRYRQFESNMVLEGDAGYANIPEQGHSGVYKVRSGRFERPGALTMEFRLLCPEVLPDSRVIFNFSIENPS